MTGTNGGCKHIVGMYAKPLVVTEGQDHLTERILLVSFSWLLKAR